MKKYKNYYIGAAVCFFLMCLALDPATDSEDPLVAAIFGVIGVFLLILPPVLEHLEKKEIERIKQERIAAEKQEAIEEQARKNEVRKRALTHFNNSPFVRQVVRDLRSRNWDNMNGKYGHCAVYIDRLVAGRTYYYDEYDMRNLSPEECEELAEFLGMAYGKKYTTELITRTVCVNSRDYRVSRNINGTVSISPEYEEGSTVKEGYKLKPVRPKPKDWY